MAVACASDVVDVQIIASRLERDTVVEVGDMDVFDGGILAITNINSIGVLSRAVRFGVCVESQV